jgi:flagellar export protein FliJ
LSAVESLIRLHRWQLDERRRQVADLDTLAAKLRQEGARLVAEQKTEQSIAADSTEAATAYGSYARRLVERRQKLEQSLASVEQQIVVARVALADAYQEVKRYEIAAANRVQQVRKRVARQQQLALDEIGIETFRRRGRNTP